MNGVLISVAVWVIFTPIVMKAIDILASLSVYGKPMKDADSLPFLMKHLNGYTINSMDDKGKIMVNYGVENKRRDDLPYIAYIKGSKLLFKWHIEDEGLIWKWSKSHKLIENKHKELMKTWKSPKISLKKL